MGRSKRSRVYHLYIAYMRAARWAWERAVPKSDQERRDQKSLCVKM